MLVGGRLSPPEPLAFCVARSQIDTNLYSRQIGTYGMETMGRLMQMKADWTLGRAHLGSGWRTASDDIPPRGPQLEASTWWFGLVVCSNPESKPPIRGKLKMSPAPEHTNPQKDSPNGGFLSVSLQSHPKQAALNNTEQAHQKDGRSWRFQDPMLGIGIDSLAQSESKAFWLL